MSDDEAFHRAVRLTERIMEHVCGWPGENDVMSVALIIARHPEVLNDPGGSE